MDVISHRIDPERMRAAVGHVREELADAARMSGRSPETVELLVAGKYIETEETPALVAAGIRLIGENRLQQLQAKQALVGDAVAFDFIGHLQRRKVREVLRRVRLIHSVDSDRARPRDRAPRGRSDAGACRSQRR